jgi:formylglycine-generating enzyme required for sulfatase activity
VRAEEHQRGRFSEILAQSIADPRIYLLMSLRADFFGELQKDEPLYGAHRQINVPPLREVELQEVVSRPAALLCARFETDHLAADIARRTAEQPVINVTWDDAQRYVAWLSRMTGKPYRLLSEAEWEYAARAGTSTPYPWGPEIGNRNANCNHCGSQWDSKRPAPVGSFAPNQFGLYDMHGNVWQWVEDCYEADYNRAPPNGPSWTSGECDRRIVRGGSWYVAPEHLRSAYRIWDATGYRDFDLGFRVGRTFTP